MTMRPPPLCILGPDSPLRSESGLAQKAHDSSLAIGSIVADSFRIAVPTRFERPPAALRRSRQLAQIDFAVVHKQLKARKNLTGWRLEFLSRAQIMGWFALAGRCTLVTTDPAFTEFAGLDLTPVGEHATP